MKNYKRDVLTFGAVSVFILAAMGCADAKTIVHERNGSTETASVTEQPQHKVIQLVPLTNEEKDKTEQVDFDLRHLSIVGKETTTDEKEETAEGADEETGYSEDGSIGEDQPVPSADGELEQGTDDGDGRASEGDTPDYEYEGGQDDLPDESDAGTDWGDYETPEDQSEYGGWDSDDATGSEEYDGEPAEEYTEPEPEPEPDSGVDGSEGEDGAVGEWVYYGNCRITHFCPLSCCCGEFATGYTASGTLATEGRTVASGYDLPFGTEVLINGNVYIVEDRGVDSYCIDVFVNEHETALAMGMYYTDVYVRYPE